MDGRSFPSRASVGVTAVAASITWGLQGLLSVALPDPTAVLDITMIVPMALTLLALGRLHREGLTGGGRFVTAGIALGVMGAIALIPGQLAFALDWGAAGDAIAAASMAGFIGALLITGIAVIRARVLPRSVGVALIAAQPLAIVTGLALSPISPLASSGDYSGALGHGIVWGLIGAALLGQRIPLLNEDVFRVPATAKA